MFHVEHISGIIGEDMQTAQYDALSSIPPMMRRGKRPAFQRANHAQLRLKSAIEDENGLVNYPQPIQEALDACTTKQRRYALLLSTGMVQYRAYIAAYEVAEDRNVDYIATESSLTASNPRIVSAVALLNRWLDCQWLLDSAQAVDWALSNLYDLAEHGKSDATKLKATELILRKHGELVNRQVITHIDGSDADSQEQLFASILSDIEAMAVIDQPQVLTLQQYDKPMQRLTAMCTCPKCGHHDEVVAFQVDLAGSGSGSGTLEDAAGPEIDLAAGVTPTP